MPFALSAALSKPLDDSKRFLLPLPLSKNYRHYGVREIITALIAYFTSLDTTLVMSFV